MAFCKVIAFLKIKINMKKILYFAVLVLAGLAQAQVAIGKQSISSNSVSLEFGADNKGFVLPYVTSGSDVVTKGVVDGTLIFDSSDKKVKLRANNAWKDLTVDTTGVVDTSIQDAKSERANAKVVIGPDGGTNTTPGILVLSDPAKAMVLPKVASPHLNIVNPAPGMMVYDTTKRQLAVFNGKVWTFWKPE